MQELDIKGTRSIKNQSKWILVKRVMWSFTQFFFRHSPRTAFGFRNSLLRLFGAKVGKEVHIYPSVEIVFPWNFEIGDWSAIGADTLIYSWGKIYIGEKVTISHKAQICAASHDYKNPCLPITYGPVHVKDQAWICTQAFVGPNVTVGEGAIIGACAVINKDTKDWGIYAGNPGQYLKDRVLYEK